MTTFTENPIDAHTRKKLLQVEQLKVSSQIRNFGNVRDLLRSHSLDADARLAELLRQRQELSEELRKIRRNEPEHERSFLTAPWGQQGRYRYRELLPAYELMELEGRPRFHFGFSGSVQMPPAQDGVNVLPNTAVTSGQITTESLRPAGGVEFDGLLSGVSSIPQDEYDPTETNVWLRNWKYLVPFPAPSWKSIFSYRFEVTTTIRLFCESDPARFMSFVSVGETNDFTAGEAVEVDQDAGWPLDADLTQPTGLYNGHYGQLSGSSIVERNFIVDAGKTPAVAIIVGAVGIIGQLGELMLQFGGVTSSIIPHDDEDLEGRIEFLYQPLPIVAE